MNKTLIDKYLRSLPPKAAVLDAGCGTGNNSRYLQTIRKDLRLTGVDIDPACKKQVPSGVAFFQGDVNQLKRFKDNSFDAVVCFHLLEHLTDPRQAIKELRRVLKKNGLMFVEAPHWVCTFLPIGTNFWDDPTHLRPHSRGSFAELFKEFTVLCLETDEPIMFHLPELYDIPRLSLTHAVRKVLSFFGLFRIAVFLIAKKG